MAVVLSPPRVSRLRQSLQVESFKQEVSVLDFMVECQGDISGFNFVQFDLKMIEQVSL